MGLEAVKGEVDNPDGQFLCAPAAVREMLRRGPQPELSSATGKIKCMSSVHQVIPWAFEVNYAASEGGVMLLMQSLAQELAADRIRVNAVALGAITCINGRLAARFDEARFDDLNTVLYVNGLLKKAQHHREESGWLDHLRALLF